MMEKSILEEEFVEEEEESAEKFTEITCRAVTSSSVIIQWIYLNQTHNKDDVFVYKVLKLETRGEWKSVAWTRKTTCQIENLEQNVCYSLKIHVLVEDETEFRVIDESRVFKVKFSTQKIPRISHTMNFHFSVQFQWFHHIKHSFVRYQNLR